nr:MAG TPA: hypothetical protein [Caudoviricetes sp.]
MLCAEMMLRLSTAFTFKPNMLLRYSGLLHERSHNHLRNPIDFVINYLKGNNNIRVCQYTT